MPRTPESDIVEPIVPSDRIGGRFVFQSTLLVDIDTPPILGEALRPKRIVIDDKDLWIVNVAISRTERRKNYNKFLNTVEPMGYKKEFKERNGETIIIPKPMDHPIEYMEYAWNGKGAMGVLRGISKTFYAAMVWVGIPLAILSVYPLVPIMVPLMLLLYLYTASDKLAKVINTAERIMNNLIKGAGSMVDFGKYGYLRGGKEN